MVKILRTKLAKLRKPFVRVGEVITYLGSTLGIGDPPVWIKSGDKATVVEFRKDMDKDCLIQDDEGEEEPWWDMAEDYAVIRFENGIQRAIHAKGEGKGWKKVF